MDNSITVALITGICVGFPSVLATYMLNRKSQAVFNYRLDNLESLQNKHNDIIKRTYNIENRMAVYDEKIIVANHRIDDLEKK